MNKFEGIVKSTNGDLRGRLYNCKFKQACRYLKGESLKVKYIIKTLSTLYGDLGWGISGLAAMPIATTVEYLIGEK